MISRKRLGKIIKNLKDLILMLKSKNQDRSSEGNQGSVNGERRGRKEEPEEDLEEEKGKIQKG